MVVVVVVVVVVLVVVIYLSICLPASLKTKLVCEISSVFELDNIENAAILRDVLKFWTWQRQKRNNSARPPQFSKLTTSKTKQFCETSFKRKVVCRADGLVPMHFVIFPFHLSKVWRLPRKSEARSYEVLRLSRKTILANLKITCSKMQPFSRNQRPDLLTSPMNMPLVLRLPREMHLCRSSSNAPRLPTVWNCYKTFTFW